MEYFKFRKKDFIYATVGAILLVMPIIAFIIRWCKCDNTVKYIISAILIMFNIMICNVREMIYQLQKKIYKLEKNEDSTYD